MFKCCACALVGLKDPIKAIGRATATEGSRNLKRLVFFMCLVFEYLISVYGLRHRYQVSRDTKTIKAINYLMSLSENMNLPHAEARQRVGRLCRLEATGAQRIRV